MAVLIEIVDNLLTNHNHAQEPWHNPSLPHRVRRSCGKLKFLQTENCNIVSLQSSLLSRRDVLRNYIFVRWGKNKEKMVPSAVIPLCFAKTPVMKREPLPRPQLSTSRLRDVCVPTHLSESRLCGCWLLIQGLTPVTTSHNTSLSSLVPDVTSDQKISKLHYYGCLICAHLPNRWLYWSRTRILT